MIRIVEVPEKLEAFFESCEYCELSAERVLTEEQIEDGMVGALLALPVRVRHGDLIQICHKQQQLNSLLGSDSFTRWLARAQESTRTKF